MAATGTNGGGQVLGASTMSYAALVDLLNSLTQQLTALQQKLVAEQFQGASCSAQFTNNLSKGMNNTDVKKLQMTLNMSSLTQLAPRGMGSPGNEGTYFGDLTKSAVIAFQNIFADQILVPAGLVSGNGYVGTATRKVLNQLCSR
jgi:peptidoglycan hydrolase-like protein with peptidoglycan-binding domain